MKRKEENRSVIEPSCTFFKPNKINFLPSNRVLDRKPDRVTGYKVLIDLTSLILSHYTPAPRKGRGVYCFTSVCLSVLPSIQDIFRRIFLSNC